MDELTLLKTEFCVQTEMHLSFICSVHMHEEELNNSLLKKNRSPVLTSHLVHLHGDFLSVSIKPHENQAPIVTCG